jgi:hypothetical protein
MPVLYALTLESEFSEESPQRDFFTPTSDDDLYTTPSGSDARFQKVGATYSFKTGAYESTVHEHSAVTGFLITGRQWPRIVVPRPGANTGATPMDKIVRSTLLNGKVRLSECLTALCFDPRVDLALDHLSQLTEENLLQIHNEPRKSIYEIQHLLRAPWIVTKSLAHLQIGDALPGDSGLGSRAFATKGHPLTEKRHIKETGFSLVDEHRRELASTLLRLHESERMGAKRKIGSDRKKWLKWRLVSFGFDRASFVCEKGYRMPPIDAPEGEMLKELQEEIIKLAASV